MKTAARARARAAVFTSVPPLAAPRPVSVRLPSPPAAIVLDVDGTLYRQRPVRVGMLLRLARAHALRPAAGLETMRALGAYRRAQERMRLETDAGADRQLDIACESCGVERTRLEALVRRWMEQEPLPLLARAARPGVREFVRDARARGVPIGVVSDYAAHAKLEALGLAADVDVVVAAADPEVRRFKPDPRGLQVALAKLGAAPGASLYVGDRPEVDAEAARRAGMPCAIVGREAPPSADWLGVRDFTVLARALFG